MAFTLIDFATISSMNFVRNNLNILTCPFTQQFNSLTIEKVLL